MPLGRISGITDFIAEIEITTDTSGLGRLPHFDVQFMHPLPGDEFFKITRTAHAASKRMAGTGPISLTFVDYDRSGGSSCNPMNGVCTRKINPERERRTIRTTRITVATYQASQR